MKKTFFIILFVFIGLSYFSAAKAIEIELKYQLPCPFKEQLGSCPPATDISGYINRVFRFTLGAAGLLAVGAIVVGAIQYTISAGSPDKQRDATSRITSAIWGIVLLFGTVLILRTINPRLPELLNPEITEKVPVSPWSCLRFLRETQGSGLAIQNCKDAGKCFYVDKETGATSCDPAPCNPKPDKELCLQSIAAPAELPPFGTYDDETANRLLQKAGISTSSTGNCSNRLNPQCTSLWGIPTSVIAHLKNIKTNCPPPSPLRSCDVIVTGGTEVGHQTHGLSKPVVDLRFNDTLAKYLKDNSRQLNIRAICTAAIHREQYSVNCNHNEPKVHLHVEFEY